MKSLPRNKKLRWRRERPAKLEKLEYLQNLKKEMKGRSQPKTIKIDSV